jgi:hypothetical protein
MHKRYLSVASIAKDGLLVVRRCDPFVPPSELIIVPRSVLDGLVTTERKVVTLGFDENSSRHNFSKPCTHDLLSVKALACSCDCIIKALKCLTLAAIESASISHGSHDKAG